MSEKIATLLGVGDLMLCMPDADSYFKMVTPVLKAADVVVGQGEIVFTSRGVKSYSEAMFPPSDPENMKALANAGFNVITLATNHIWDSGVPGVEDTLNGFKDLGIAVTGGGMTLEEARTPAIIERKGARFGFLSYNCVGPKESWATAEKPGCSYVRVLTHYEQQTVQPGIKPAIYTFAEPSSLRAMQDDIRKLRSQVDVVVVCLHKGLVHTPVTLLDYDREIPYAAIDAGADLILGTHPHILKGVEIYKGKAIFHCLCNFVTPNEILTSYGADSAVAKEWAIKRKELFGFDLDPEYPTYPFHSEAKYSIVAKCTVVDGKISRVSYLPLLINKQAQPEILKNDARGQEVFAYMEKITRAADLNAQFEWDGDEVVIHGEGLTKPISQREAGQPRADKTVAPKATARG